MKCILKDVIEIESNLEYDSISDYHEGKAIFKLNGKYGILDENGEVLIEAKYDSISDYNEGKAIFGLNEKYGVLDENGEEMTIKKIFEFQDIIDIVKLLDFFTKQYSSYKNILYKPKFLLELDDNIVSFNSSEERTSFMNQIFYDNQVPIEKGSQKVLQ